jgi:hypothetical protein
MFSVLRFQKLEDTKGVIRIRKSKNRKHNGQKLEDTKGVIRIRKSKNSVSLFIKKFQNIFIIILRIT